MYSSLTLSAHIRKWFASIVCKIALGLKLQGLKCAHLGSEILGKRDYLGPKICLCKQYLFLHLLKHQMHTEKPCAGLFDVSIYPDFIFCLKISGGQLIIWGISKIQSDYLGI